MFMILSPRQEVVAAAQAAHAAKQHQPGAEAPHAEAPHAEPAGTPTEV
jgi:hypothetical protein